MAGEKVGEAYVELQARMGKFEAQLRSAKMLTGTATAKMQTGMNNVAMATKKTSAAMKLLKVAIGAIGFIAVIMAFKKIVQATAQFEDAQLELRKTSGMTRAEIDKFSGRMKNMAAVMPTSTTGLLEIAAAAARLGIQGSDNLADFSETVIKMATATQYTEEQASLDFAKIATVMKLPYKEIGRLGSAMNELANTTTATAPIIGDFTRRVAGAGSTLGLTIPQLTAMGATLDSLGVTTQVAGTAMSNFFTKMLTKAKTFAEQAGMAVEDWNRLVEVDAYEALQKWLSAMDKMKPIERAAALGELKMAGARMTDTLMKLSGAQELLNKNLITSQKAFEENTSLQKEYDIALEGLSAQWNIFTGNVINLAIAIGTKLSPALKQIMKGLNVIIDGLQFFINNWTQVWQAAYQILVETFKHMGKTIRKFFTDPAVFKAGLNLYFQFWKAVLMSATRTMEMIRDVIARASSIIWAPLIKSLQWVADNIVYYFNLGMQLAQNAVFKGINIIGETFAKGLNAVFGPIFKKLGIDIEEALTFEIPEITLQQPKKFTDRMGEAWEIIKEQYSKIPGDLKRYVDDLAMEWENVTRAAGEFGEAVDWADYKKKLAAIIEQLKALGVDTAALEKEQEKLNKTLDKTRGLLIVIPGALGTVINKSVNWIKTIKAMGIATHKTYGGLSMLQGLLKSTPGVLIKVKTKTADYITTIKKMGIALSKTYRNLSTLAGLLKSFPGVLVKVKNKTVDWIGKIRSLGAATSKTYSGLFMLQSLLKSFPGTLVKVKDKTVNWITAIRNLGAATMKTYFSLSTLQGLLKAMPGPLVKVKDRTVNWIEAIRNLGAATSKTYAGLSMMDGLLKAMPGPLVKVKNETVNYMEAIRKTGPIIQETVQITKVAIGKISRAWRGLTRDIKSAWRDFFVDIISGTESLKDAFQSLGEAIKRAFIEAFARALVEKMGFDKIFEGNILSWGGLLKGLGSLVVGVFKGIGNIIGGVLGGVGGALGGETTVVAGQLGGVTTQMGIMTKIGLGLQKVVLGLGSAFKFFATMGASATTVLGALASGLVGVAGFAATAIGAWTGFAYLAENVIGPALHGVKNFISELLGIDTRPWFEEIAESAEKAGEYLTNMSEKIASGLLTPQMLANVSGNLMHFAEVVASGLVTIGDMTHEESVKWLTEFVQANEHLTEEYKSALLGILEASTEGAQAVAEATKKAMTGVHHEILKLDHLNRDLIERGSKASADQIAKQVVATEKAIEETTGAVKKSFEEQLSSLKRLTDYGTEAYWHFYREAKASFEETTEAVKKETEKTWGRTGSVPIAHSQAINTMIAKARTFPTRIDFDVVGKLSMPSIPRIGTQYFDIVGVPSAQGGIPNIPRPMIVKVHKEEAILNPSQAKEWREGERTGGLRTYNWNVEIKSLIPPDDPMLWRRLVRDHIKRALDEEEGRRV